MSGQGLSGDTPSSHLWHHVRHELLSSKTRLNGHHQNHVHKRDKGNHLLHWCSWLDANTNLGGGGEGRGKEREGKGEQKGYERKGRGGGGKREEKNVRRQRTDSLALRLGWKKEEGMRIGVGGERRRGWESGRERQ